MSLQCISQIIKTTEVFKHWILTSLILYLRFVFGLYLSALLLKVYIYLHWFHVYNFSKIILRENFSLSMMLHVKISTIERIKCVCVHAFVSAFILCLCKTVLLHSWSLWLNSEISCSNNIRYKCFSLMFTVCSCKNILTGLYTHKCDRFFFLCVVKLLSSFLWFFSWQAELDSQQRSLIPSV